MEKNSTLKVEEGSSHQDDENTVKGNWSNKVEFLLSLIGYSVGIGNIWRFPYLCYRNGGGAFLIPYFTMLILAGVPLYYLELLIGQYSSLGVTEVWKLSPLFKGLGVSVFCLTGVVNIYFNTLSAYVLFYLFASMTTELPWAHCGNHWNTAACKEMSTGNELIDVNATVGINVTQMTVIPSNESFVGNETSLKFKSPAEEYFERYVLDISDGIDDLGPVKWQLALCLLLGWSLIFLALVKGIKSVGKVVYFTAIFPYVVLLILLCRGLTLDGFELGLYYYVVPDWEKLTSPRVWGDAAAQIFFSLGPCWGCLITFSSYSKFHHNCLRDAVITSVINSATSILAGTVIFSVIGFMAHDMNVPVKDVMTSGPGLAFVAYPEALSRMPIGPLWSVIFFLMLLTTSVDTMFSMIETMIVAMSDAFPETVGKRKALVTLAVCVGYYLLGLPQVTRGGMYIFNIFDWYIALVTPLIIGLLEVIVISCVYGYSRIAEDVYVMIGKRPNFYFRITWCFFTPLVIVAILVFNIIQHKPVVYNDYVYPEGAVIFGWVLCVSPLLPLPLYMIYAIIKHMNTSQGRKTGLLLTLKELCRPAADWGPMMPANRAKVGLPPLGEVMEPLTL